MVETYKHSTKYSNKSKLNKSPQSCQATTNKIEILKLISFVGPGLRQIGDNKTGCIHTIFNFTIYGNLQQQRSVCTL